MKILLILLCFLFCGCTRQDTDTAIDITAETESSFAVATAETVPIVTEAADPIDALLEAMTTEELVGQLFLARCDDAVALKDIQAYHLGGFVLFGRDFEGQTPESMTAKLSGYQQAATIPLLIAVDEEGGTVNRVSSNRAFRASPFPSPRSAFDAGGMEQALKIEEEKCRLLASIGINVNLGPVCDISTERGAYMYSRSLGQDAHITGAFIGKTVYLMASFQIGSVLKHFPGYGNNSDTHTGITVDSRSLSELESCDLIPFVYGFEADADAVMVSHTVVEAMDGSLPASLSPSVHNYLREDMGFDGVIITDDLAMSAITERYGSAEAAVLAVLAGNDLLCSTDYRTQYNAVLAAVQEGRIDREILENAARRVLRWKAELKLI